MHQLGFRVVATSSLYEEADRLTELQQWNAGELVLNSPQLEEVGALVRCQKSRQDTKTTRRRCVVEVGSRPGAKAWSVVGRHEGFRLNLVPGSDRTGFRCLQGIWRRKSTDLRTKVRGLG